MNKAALQRHKKARICLDVISDVEETRDIPEVEDDELEERVQEDLQPRNMFQIFEELFDSDEKV